MTSKQRVNKHQKNKSNRRTTRKGARGRRENVFLHGKGKGLEKMDSSKKRKVLK